MSSFSNGQNGAESAVEIISRGQTMRGFLHRPHNFSAAQRVPAALFFHGFTGNCTEPHRLFVKAARVLAASGNFNYEWTRKNTDEERKLREVGCEYSRCLFSAFSSVFFRVHP